MLNKMAVQEAIKRSLAMDISSGFTTAIPPDFQNPEISMLIHDFFGGEILKTPEKEGWHLYNRVDGERIDFTKQETDKPSEDNNFEDIPCTSDETNDYLKPDEYSTFYMKFIIAYEETIGLSL